MFSRRYLAPLVAMAPLFLLMIRGLEVGRYAIEDNYVWPTAVLAFLFYLYLFLAGKLRRTSVTVAIYGLLFCGSIGVTIFVTRLTGLTEPMSEQVANLVKVFGVVLWIAFLAEVDWTAKETRAIFFLGAIPLLGITLMAWAAEGGRIPYQGFTRQKNNLGMAAAVMLIMSMFFIRTHGRKLSTVALATLGLSLLCLFVSASRSSQAMVIAAVGLFWILSPIRQVGWGFVFLVVFAELSVASIPMAFLELEEATGGSMELFGREVFNGRQRIWAHLFDAIKERPMFGYGTMWVTGAGHGAHNLALGVLYQSGLVGFGFFALWQGGVCERLRRGMSNPARRLGLAFFLSCLLVHQSFQLSLAMLHIGSLVLLLPTGLALSLDPHGDGGGEPPVPAFGLRWRHNTVAVQYEPYVPTDEEMFVPEGDAAAEDRETVGV